MAQIYNKSNLTYNMCAYDNNDSDSYSLGLIILGEVRENLLKKNKGQ